MIASILSVGTELTDGQITNRNAAWLSERIKPLGFRAALHVTVPDDRPRILEALAHCEERSELILVTGGLGPTSDDFTRDLVAEWAERPLLFNEESWKHVTETLTARGVPVHDFQKQQCEFPEGSILLPNPMGTAYGFRLRVRGKDVIVLPGPPREIEAVWEGHLGKWLAEKGKDLDPIETKAWQVLGLGEARLTALMEPLVENHGVEVGYRVHLPYVEFKISYPRSTKEQHRPLVERIEQALSEWTPVKDGEDLAKSLMEKLQAFPAVSLVDELSGRYLPERLAPHWGLLSGRTRFVFSNVPTASPEGLSLKLSRVGETKARIQCGPKTVEIEAPMKADSLSERRKQYFTESALAWWARNLGPAD